MTFSEYAGTVVVPTLSRLVLCAAFLTQGANKLFKEAEFSSEEAEKLAELGIDIKPIAGRQARGELMIHPASHRIQDEPGERQEQPELEPPPAEVPPSGAEDVGDQPAVVIASDPDVTYGARGMHKVTLILTNQGWPEPVWMALLAACTELVGGALLLVGLFSRIWGLGLAITMGVAFYLVSMGFNQVHATSPFAFAENTPAFNTLFTQTSLFVLALGIFLTGPGPLSLDRLLFRRPGRAGEHETADAH